MFDIFLSMFSLSSLFYPAFPRCLYFAIICPQVKHKISSLFLFPT